MHTLSESKLGRSSSTSIIIMWHLLRHGTVANPAMQRTARLPPPLDSPALPARKIDCSDSASLFAAPNLTIVSELQRVCGTAVRGAGQVGKEGVAQKRGTRVEP